MFLYFVNLTETNSMDINNTDKVEKIGTNENHLKIYINDNKNMRIHNYQVSEKKVHS